MKHGGPPVGQSMYWTKLLYLLPIGIGKLSQHQNQSQTEFTQDPYRVTELFTDNSLEISHCMLVNENTLQIRYQKIETYLRVNRRAQTCIWATVTDLARIYLDKSMRAVQDQGCELIYCDTGKDK